MEGTCARSCRRIRIWNRNIAARPKGTRDIALALRFATSAMVRNDPDALQAEAAQLV